MGYSLGMVKIEAFDDRRFMHQTIRVFHTDHSDSIIACIACSFDLKKMLLETHQNLHSDSGL